MTSRILGLDISTSCTGYCILESDGTLLELGHIKLDKIESFSAKCIAVKEKLIELNVKYQMTIVSIEQNLQAFRPGLSSASTINTLARFNGAISFICFDVLKVEPIFINAIKSRSSLGIKIDYKDKSRSTKDKIYEWVSKQIVFDWPKSRTGSLKSCCYDMADSYVIARSAILV